MSIIKVNMDKFKVIAHEQRRAARARDFQPFDEIIMKQIPGADSQAAEAERQKIRDKYGAIQSNIDAATTSEQINAIMQSFVEA
jgi:hypothetical protein